MLFPLIFLIFNRRKKEEGKGPSLNKNFLYIVLGLILISLITHILLFDINNINRIYFGTDTRAFSLLVGVVGALLYPMDKLSNPTNSKENLAYSVVSIISISILITIMFYTTEYNTWLYRGGFLLVAVLGLIIIISSGKQHTFISKALSFKPIVFIGKISYSLYLWHFPIIVLTTPVSEIGNPNLFYVTLRIILTFIVATLSYLVVETPIRKLGFVNYINLVYKKLLKLRLNIKRGVASSFVIILILFVMGLFGKGIPFLSTAFVKEMDTNKTIILIHQKIRKVMTKIKKRKNIVHY